MNPFGLSGPTPTEEPLAQVSPFLAKRVEAACGAIRDSIMIAQMQGLNQQQWLALPETAALTCEFHAAWDEVYEQTGLDPGGLYAIDKTNGKIYSHSAVG